MLLFFSSCHCFDTGFLYFLGDALAAAAADAMRRFQKLQNKWSLI